MNGRRSGSLMVDCCSAFGSTCPAPLPQRRPWHGAADRILAATRPQITPLVAVAGVLASITSAPLGGGLRMLPLAVFFLAVGGWCLLNFARRREAHCVVTGLGWSLLGVASLAGAALGRDWRAAAWIAFFLVLGGGICFEIAWKTIRGSTALRA